MNTIRKFYKAPTEAEIQQVEQIFTEIAASLAADGTQRIFEDVEEAECIEIDSKDLRRILDITKSPRF